MLFSDIELRVLATFARSRNLDPPSHLGETVQLLAFSGPLQDQFRDCLNYLENLSATHLQKQRDRSQVRGWVSYPLSALRETLVNALYHRSYESDHPDPIKIYLYPDRIEITSYPGPVPGIEPHHLTQGGQPRAVPARNRRIGEFFKELKLAEGRLTGLATNATLAESAARLLPTA